MQSALGQRITVLLSGVFALALLTVVMTGTRLLIDHTFGRTIRPTVEYWAIGGMLAASMLAVRWVYQSGMVRGFLRDPAKMRELRDRQESLRRSRASVAAKYGNK